eukprot:gene7534-9259_t
MNNNIFPLCCGNGNVEIIKFIKERYQYKKRYGLTYGIKYAIDSISNSSNSNSSFIELFEYLVNNFPEMIKHYFAYFNNIKDKRFSKAIQSDIEIRDWFFNNRDRLEINKEFRHVFIEDAIRKRDLKRLKFYVEEMKEYFDLECHDYQQYIIENFQDECDDEVGFEITKYLVDNEIGGTDVTRLIKGSIFKGKVKEFEYLFDIVYRQFPEVTSILLRNGFWNECTLPIVEYVFQYDKDDRYSSLKEAQVPDSEMTHCFHGDLQLLKFFHEMPNPIIKFSTNSMDRASGYGYIEIVKFLHFNRTEGCGRYAFWEACEKNHYLIVEFLLKNNRDCIYLNVANLFGMSGEMKNYLKQNIEYLPINSISIIDNNIGQPSIDYNKSNFETFRDKVEKSEIHKIINKHKLFSYGDLEVYKILENSKDFKVELNNLHNVAINGRFTMLKYMKDIYHQLSCYFFSLQKRFFWSEYIDKLYSNGCFETIKFLLTHVLIPHYNQHPRILSEPGDTFLLINEKLISSLMESKQAGILATIIDLTPNNVDLTPMGQWYSKIYNRPSLKILKLLIQQCHLDPNVHFQMDNLLKKCIQLEKFSIIRYLLEYIPFESTSNNNNDSKEEEEEVLFRMVRYMVESKMGVIDSDRLLQSTFRNGNVKAFEFMYNKLYRENPSKTSLILVKAGFLDQCQPSIIYHMFRFENDKRYSRIKNHQVPDTEMTHCFHGDVQLLKFFHDMPNPIIKFSTDTYERASILGYLDIIKFLHFNRTEVVCSKTAFINAAVHNHFELVQFFIQFKSDLINYERLYNSRLSFEMIKFLKQNNINIPTNPFKQFFQTSSSSTSTSTNTNNVQTKNIYLHFKYNNSFNYDKIGIQYKRIFKEGLFSHGDLKLLKLLENDKCFPIDYKDLQIAAINGRLSMVKYILEKVSIPDYFWKNLLMEVYHIGCLESFNSIMNELLNRAFTNRDLCTEVLISVDVIKMLMELKYVNTLRSIVKTLTVFPDIDISIIGSYYSKTKRPSLKILKLLIQEFQLDPNIHIKRLKLIKKCTNLDKQSVIKYLLELPYFQLNDLDYEFVLDYIPNRYNTLTLSE